MGAGGKTRSPNRPVALVVPAVRVGEVGILLSRRTARFGAIKASIDVSGPRVRAYGDAAMGEEERPIEAKVFESRSGSNEPGTDDRGNLPHGSPASPRFGCPAHLVLTPITRGRIQLQGCGRFSEPLIGRVAVRGPLTPEL